MHLMDFSGYPLSGRFYTGSERKIGILISGSPYMLKFPRQTAFGKRLNHVSEYLGSRIFALLGFSAQETYLGFYRGEEVVACRDFNIEGAQFVPFNEVGESTLDADRETYQYEYADIMRMLRDNSKLTNVAQTIQIFWEMFIVDALLGNFDRHGSNWGFMKRDNAYSLAPIFDNGSCLFPALTDEEEMLRIIASQDETERRVFTFPTSQIKLSGRKSSYYDVISSMAFPECNTALASISSRADLQQILAVTDDVSLITPTRRAFTRHMLTARWEMIIERNAKSLREKK